MEWDQTPIPTLCSQLKLRASSPTRLPSKSVNRNEESQTVQITDFCNKTFEFNLKLQSRTRSKTSGLKKWQLPSDCTHFLSAAFWYTAFAYGSFNFLFSALGLLTASILISGCSYPMFTSTTD